MTLALFESILFCVLKCANEYDDVCVRACACVCVCVRACVRVYQELEALERRTSALFAVEVRAREAEELNDTLLASLARIEERFQVQVRRATNE